MAQHKVSYTQEEFEVASSADGLTLAAALTMPATTPKGIVFMLHGMEEHKERYYPFMEYLAHSGYASVIHDMRGHGKSLKAPQDLGFFYDKTGIAILTDIIDVKRAACKKTGNIPRHIFFAHSMGTLLALNHLQEHDGAYDAAVLMGVPHNNAAALGKFFVDVISFFKGDRARSRFIGGLVSGSYARHFKGTSPHRWLSGNTDNVAQYDSDPFCGFGFTLNGYRNLFCAMQHAYTPARYHMQHPELPLLMLAGEDDPVIGDGASGFAETQAFLERLGYRPRLKLYPGKRHELLHEDSAGEVMQDIVNFIG